MRVELQVLIYNGFFHDPGCGPTLSNNAFQEVFAFAREQQLTGEELASGSIAFRVACPPEHEAVPELYERLAREGWTPYYGYVQAGSTSRFRPRLIRRYEPEDYDQAPLFYAQCFQMILDVSKNDGLDEQGWRSNGIDIGDEDDGWKEEVRVASMGLYNYFVRADLKEALLAAGLVGLDFRPLRWSGAERPAETYWELRCTRTMPPCLLPVVPMDDRAGYDEAYKPEELQFRRVEVESMGEFDVAWTAEELGNPQTPNWGRHALVFSPRFRAVMQQEGVSDHAMITRLARLVD